MSEPLRRCGSCRTALKFLKREKLQLGQTGWILGDWPNLIAGAQDLEFWVCPHCRKLEFFLPANPEEEWEEGSIAQVTCPACGAEYDMDYPKCPCCKAENPNM